MVYGPLVILTIAELAPPHAQSAWGSREGKGLSSGINNILSLFLAKKKKKVLQQASI